MRAPDTDREESEKMRSPADFLTWYNEHLPAHFPRASKALLQQFQDANADLFKTSKDWSLHQHRKKLMDWLPSHSV